MATAAALIVILAAARVGGATATTSDDALEYSEKSAQWAPGVKQPLRNLSNTLQQTIERLPQVALPSVTESITEVNLPLPAEKEEQPDVDHPAATEKVPVAAFRPITDPPGVTSRPIREQAPALSPPSTHPVKSAQSKAKPIRVTRFDLAGRDPVDVVTDTELPSFGKFLIHSGVEAVFTSPEYPAKYPANTWTTWIFKAAAAADTLQVACSQLELGRRDSVTVRSKEKRFQVFTSGSPPPAVSSAGPVTVELYAGDSGRGLVRCTARARLVRLPQPADFRPVAVNDRLCGVSTAPLLTRIVGGADAARNAFPWLVGMSTRARPDMYCGGSIINERYIITAGHCVSNRKVWSLGVQVRKHIRMTDPDEKRFLVKRVILHPEFQRLPPKNDLALIELKESLRLLLHDADGRVRPVCLPTARCDGGDGDACFGGAAAWVAGWGVLKEHTRRYPRVVQQVQVPILSSADCRAVQPGFITDRMLCTSFPDGGRDACQGDSGGPLMVQNSDGVTTLAGLVSFGRGCGRAEHPAVYTRVSEYTDWIMQNAQL